MGDQIMLLVLGFVLTSVAGGFLGYYFQRRTWDANRRESERQAAATVFDEVSRAMDRRLYRMWLLHWRLESGDADGIEKALDAYRAVLEEWNDSLNRNLALSYRNFGEGVWKYLDRVLYEDFARLGRRLEDRYNEGPNLDPGPSARFLGGQLKALSDDIYVLNRFLVSLIQHGRVGLYQSKEDWPERPPWDGELRRGSEGPRVAEWQRDLNLVLKDKVVVDGRFGRATHEATVALQRAHELEPDGIVGRRTRQKMDELLPRFVAPTW
jgi:peptidoglycan hydrolase-like protein with peptidoglycan-binding domain